MKKKNFKDFQRQMTSISRKIQFWRQKNKVSKMIKNKGHHFSKKESLKF